MYIPILEDPAEFNGSDQILCLNCQLDLTDEEIKEDMKNCFSCTEEIEQKKITNLNYIKR
tara:strand:+ start:329 stop:508 length:180 start_codon:yes stop_codon:yes gene_type:complete